MKFTIIKSCLARFSGTFAVGTPSNIHGAALSYRCAKFGAFVNSVTILTLRDLTMWVIIFNSNTDPQNPAEHKSQIYLHILSCLEG